MPQALTNSGQTARDRRTLERKIQQATLARQPNWRREVEVLQAALHHLERTSHTGR